LLRAAFLAGAPVILTLLSIRNADAVVKF